MYGLGSTSENFNSGSFGEAESILSRDYDMWHVVRLRSVGVDLRSIFVRSRETGAQQQVR
jgi:hypothetical protein